MLVKKKWEGEDEEDSDPAVCTSRFDLCVYRKMLIFLIILGRLGRIIL